MDSPARVSLKMLILGTKLGRMSLFAGFLLILLFAVPYGCAKRPKSRGEDEALAKRVGEKKEDDLPASPQGFQDTLTLGQKYDALIKRWGSEVAHTKLEVDSTRKELEALRNALAQERTEGAAGKKEFTETLRRLEEGLKKDLGGGPRPTEGGEASPVQAAGSPHALRSLSFPPPAPAKTASAEKRSVHVPAASGGQATLLNGVFAPVSGEPSPVRLRFDSAILGPNRSRLGLRGAFLIGKAQGEANSSRVTIQVDRLSYVAPDGRTLETKALGYVVGQDGLEGVPGAYEWRALELLPLAVMTSGLGAGSEALALGEASRSITPLGGAIDSVSGNPLKYAGFRTVGGGAGKLTEILAERMREIRPAVSVPPGQEVTVVFLEGVTLEGLGVLEIAQGRNHDPFRGLDFHR